MDTHNHTGMGLGRWVVIILCVVLMVGAAARADTPKGDGPTHTDEATDTATDTATETDSNADTATDSDSDPDTDTDSDTVNATATAPATATDSPPATATDAKAVCLARPVVIVRVTSRPYEARPLRLTHCDGRPHRGALDALSILARPHGVDRPGPDATPPDEDHVAPGVLRLHPGLLTRLQALANRWPHRRIEIVSGHRPDERRTSRHHHGRALDLRVRGVPRRQVAEHARTLDRTGVGFYPNSVFTHVDVRHHRTYWVDRSGPGEPADYGPWPPPEQERERLRERILAEAFEALAPLERSP